MICVNLDSFVKVPILFISLLALGFLLYTNGDH